MRKRRHGQKNLRAGTGWRLSHGNGGKPFAASLLKTINRGHVRLAIFSVPKRGNKTERT